jgi:hypothetical protein
MQQLCNWEDMPPLRQDVRDATKKATQLGINDPHHPAIQSIICSLSLFISRPLRNPFINKGVLVLFPSPQPVALHQLMPTDDALLLRKDTQAQRDVFF